jgi:hypothetical protein
MRPWNWSLVFSEKARRDRGDDNELDCLEEAIQMVRKGTYNNFDYIEAILRSCKTNLKERPDEGRRWRLDHLRSELKKIPQRSWTETS